MNRQEVKFTGIAITVKDETMRQQIIKYLDLTRNSVIYLPLNRTDLHWVKADAIPVMVGDINEGTNAVLHATSKDGLLPILCIKVEESYDEIDNLRYHYRIQATNDMRAFILQLESVLNRYPRLRRSKSVGSYADCRVRVVDQNDNFFWQEGNIVHDIDNDPSVEVEFKVRRKMLRTDLIRESAF